MALMEIGSIIISIHAPRKGGDCSICDLSFICQLFQSTPPARGATMFPAMLWQFSKKISIHAPRKGGDIVHRMPIHKIPISIHAPRKGGDLVL